MRESPSGLFPLAYSIGVFPLLSLTLILAPCLSRDSIISILSCAHALISKVSFATPNL